MCAPRGQTQRNFPEAFYCTITQEVMVDPVVDPEGHSYERQAIETWLETKETSPVSYIPRTSVYWWGRPSPAARALRVLRYFLSSGDGSCPFVARTKALHTRCPQAGHP